MGLPFFRRSVELSDRYLRPRQRAVYTIQTNDTFLDPELGVVLQGARLSRRGFDRGAERVARRLPCRQGRERLELVASTQQRQFGLAKRETLPRYCRECDVRFACHGGCPTDRFIETPNGEPGLNYLCAGYKAFFHHVDRPMRFMSERLRLGEAPAEIRSVYADEDARRGRNEPCTCGSGRKWKRCHGAPSPS